VSTASCSDAILGLGIGIGMTLLDGQKVSPILRSHMSTSNEYRWARPQDWYGSLDKRYCDGRSARDIFMVGLRAFYHPSAVPSHVPCIWLCQVHGSSLGAV